MSTTDRDPATLPSGLFTGLVDDAAVFPPGLAPIDQAVRDHLAWRTSPVAGYLGPLLVPFAAASEAAVQAAHHHPSTPLPVVLIARPGATVTDLGAAIDQVRTKADVRVAGVELAHQDGWEQSLTWDVPVVIEVPRDSARSPGLIAEVAASADGADLRVKLRTQSTPTDPVPAAAEVTTVLQAAHRHGIGVKFTGGLHHAVATTGTSPDGAIEEQHGVLNLLWASHLVRTGADIAQVLDFLAERDPDVLIAELCGLSEAQVREVRSLFTTFGCCGVLDPLGELAALRAIAPLPIPADTPTIRGEQ